MLRAVRILLLLAITSVPCAARALALPKQGERWVRADSAHFTFFSNASAKRTAAIARRLEQFRHVLAEINRVDAASPVPILIYAFRSDAALVPYKRNPDGSVMNVSGFFSAGGDADYVALDASVGCRPGRAPAPAACAGSRPRCRQGAGATCAAGASVAVSACHARPASVWRKASAHCLASALTRPI